VLYIFAVIGNPICLPRSMMARDMFIVSRTIEGDVTRLARNVPLVVLKKCCFISEWFYIQHDNCPVLWLAETFLTYFPNFHIRSPGLWEMFLYRYWRSVHNFWNGLKSKMAVLTSHWTGQYFFSPEELVLHPDFTERFL